MMVTTTPGHIADAEEHHHRHQIDEGRGGLHGVEHRPNGGRGAFAARQPDADRQADHQAEEDRCQHQRQRHHGLGPGADEADGDQREHRADAEPAPARLPGEQAEEDHHEHVRDGQQRRFDAAQGAVDGPANGLEYRPKVGHQPVQAGVDPVAERDHRLLERVQQVQRGLRGVAAPLFASQSPGVSWRRRSCPRDWTRRPAPAGFQRRQALLPVPLRPLPKDCSGRWLPRASPVSPALAQGLLSVAAISGVPVQGFEQAGLGDDAQIAVLLVDHRYATGRAGNGAEQVADGGIGGQCRNVGSKARLRLGCERPSSWFSESTETTPWKCWPLSTT
jgi:hypothetical protein